MILAAVSGGSDSKGLLLALHEAITLGGFSAFSLSACTVDHALRPNPMRKQNAVAAFCAQKRHRARASARWPRRQACDRYSGGSAGSALSPACRCRAGDWRALHRHSPTPPTIRSKRLPCGRHGRSPAAPGLAGNGGQRSCRTPGLGAAAFSSSAPDGDPRLSDRAWGGVVR